MAQAIYNFFSILANINKVTDVLISTGLKSPIAANQKQHIRFWIPVTAVGADGGIKLQILVPAGGTIYAGTIRLNNTVAPGAAIAAQLTSAAFDNALANAGDHWIEGEATIINGATAGNIDIQMAQKVTDSDALIILRGGTMEVLKF